MTAPTPAPGLPPFDQYRAAFDPPQHEAHPPSSQAGLASLASFAPPQHEAHPPICHHADGSEHELPVDDDGLADFDTECDAPADRPPLPDLLAMLEHTVEDLDLIENHLAAHRHDTADDAAQLALHAVGDNAGRAWAHARLAIADLREALAVEPPAGPCGARLADRNDMWWTCQRATGHVGQHVSVDRVWHGDPAVQPRG